MEEDTIMSNLMRSRMVLSVLLTGASASPTTSLARRRAAVLAPILLIVLYLLLARLIGSPLPVPTRGGGCHGVPIPC